MRRSMGGLKLFCFHPFHGGSSHKAPGPVRICRESITIHDADPARLPRDGGGGNGKVISGSMSRERERGRRRGRGRADGKLGSKRWPSRIKSDDDQNGGSPGTGTSG